MNWRAYGSPTYEQWRQIVTAAGGPSELASREAWAAAGEHGWLALAVGMHESRLGTTFNKMPPENNNPFGLRPRSKPGYQKFDTWIEAVAEFRDRIADPLYRYAPTRTLAEFVHVYSPDSDNTPGQEEAYVGHVTALLEMWDAIKEELTMPIVAKECPVETYVQWSGANRPGLAMPSPSKIVNHEVGNKAPGADEDMHRRFVLSGGGPALVSFHFVVGPTKIVQLLYLDENAWHASDGYWGDGNRDAWGIEHIQIGDFDRTLAHSAWLQAELARNPRRFAIKNPASFVPDITPANVFGRMVQHYDEAPDRKNCPEMMRARGLFIPLKQAVVAALAPAKPEYAAPDPPPWERGDVGTTTLGEAKAAKITAELTATARTQPRKYASGTSERTGPAIEIGQKIVVIGALTVPGAPGKRPSYWYIRADGSRVRASAFTPRLPFV